MDVLYSCYQYIVILLFLHIWRTVIKVYSWTIPRVCLCIFVQVCTVQQFLLYTITAELHTEGLASLLTVTDPKQCNVCKKSVMHLCIICVYTVVLNLPIFYLNLIILQYLYSFRYEYCIERSRVIMVRSKHIYLKSCMLQ